MGKSLTVTCNKFNLTYLLTYLLTYVVSASFLNYNFSYIDRLYLTVLRGINKDSCFMQGFC